MRALFYLHIDSCAVRRPAVDPRMSLFVITIKLLTVHVLNADRFRALLSGAIVGSYQADCCTVNSTSSSGKELARYLWLAKHTELRYDW